MLYIGPMGNSKKIKTRCTPQKKPYTLPILNIKHPTCLRCWQSRRNRNWKDMSCGTGRAGDGVSNCPVRLTVWDLFWHPLFLMTTRISRVLPTIPKMLRTILQPRWLCWWQNSPASYSCFNSSASNEQETLTNSCILNSNVAQPSDVFSPSSPFSTQSFGNGNISE